MSQRKRVYRVNDFAQATGVTVRTLHHYDRLGLLQPANRTEAGYRLYSDADIVRLQQIVTLKFIGMSLQQIRDVLTKRRVNVLEALTRQQRLLERKRSQLDHAIAALELAKRYSGNASAEPEAFRKIIEVIEMASN